LKKASEKEMKKIIVAIDGYSSCGKSTIAKELAREMDYVYVDTGAMYRAVSLFCIKNGWMTENEINTQELENISLLFGLNLKPMWMAKLKPI